MTIKHAKRSSSLRAVKAACLASATLLPLTFVSPASAQAAPSPAGSAPTGNPALSQPQGTSADPVRVQDNASVQAQSTSDQGQSSGVADVVVTARRASENLQNVPVSEQVITGAALEKLSLTRVDEISKLAPGLTLQANGSSTSVTLRGVTWAPGSGTPATPIYFNEVPFDPAQVIASLYDFGQVEVLRGPQGTSRGAPSISGAVTIATRKPDLTQFGGYVQGLYGSGDHKDAQGAVNIPIIKDVLAVRFAANIEEQEGNRIYSVNSGVKPFFRDRSYRATVLFKPTDTISIEGMYQRRRTLTELYTQVAGTGSPGFAGVPGASPAIAANFNGPALSVNDRASVQDLPSHLNQHIDLITLNASWEVLGHVLSYNFGRQINTSPVQYNAVDTLNILPGFEVFTNPNFNYGNPYFQTNEIRLSSLPNENRPFDYDIGWFSKHSAAISGFNTSTYLTGAFGSPATAAPGATTTPNSRYVLNARTAIPIAQYFDSFYGNVRFHIDERTELSGGISILRDRDPVALTTTSDAAFTAFANPLLPSRTFCPFASPGAIASPVYTTGVVCEIGLPAGFANNSLSFNSKYSDALYNVSLSHKFTDDLLVYATSGSSFRTGLPALDSNGLPANLTIPLPERAKSYEAGFKSSLFERRLRVNVDVFQLDYENQLTSFQGITYYNTTNGRLAQTGLAFYRNINARVRGVEAEIASRPFTSLSLDANISYSQIKSRGGTVPCNDASRPITAANPINFCASPSGQVLNQQAPFQATVNGDYEVPIVDSFGGYFRFNVNYQGKNPNFGNFQTASGFRSTPGYARVDLFAGITGKGGAWDLGFYAKNVFDTVAELTRTATINSVYTQFAAPSGYDVVTTNLRRELGVTLRYSFGSR